MIKDNFKKGIHKFELKKVIDLSFIRSNFLIFNNLIDKHHHNKKKEKT